MTTNPLKTRLETAIECWKAAIGDHYVFDNPDTCRQAEETTFATDQRILAILYPADTAEIQACIRIASRYSIHLYPTSRGRNWGMGSRVPVQTNGVLIDLKRMTAIQEFNDQLGYITIEPGVTFEQIAAFLDQQKSSHFLPMIGGPPDSSLIGNFLERGDGAGPTGERVLHACQLEVVLGTGEVIQTGFGRIPHSKLGALDRWGIGPSLDGLFSQSNFGIVTRLSIWLSKRPNHFSAFLFVIDSESNMNTMIPALQNLQSEAVIQPSSVSLWNRYKLATSLSRHPAPTKETIDIDSFLAKHLPKFKSLKWLGMGALYSASRFAGFAHARLVRQRLKKHCKQLIFIDETKSSWLRILNRVASALHLPKLIDEQILENLVTRSVFLGHPSTQSIQSLYWRKPPSFNSTSMDPHRDRCGLHWLCHSVPYTNHDYALAAKIATEVPLNYGLEPSLIFVGTCSRFLRLCLALHYDRDVRDADVVAKECHDHVAHDLNNAGYTSCRLGIQSMNQRALMDPPYSSLVTKLKRICDPEGIIAPGRYSMTQAEAFGHE